MREEGRGKGAHGELNGRASEHRGAPEATNQRRRSSVANEGNGGACGIQGASGVERFGEAEERDEAELVGVSERLGDGCGYGYGERRRRRSAVRVRARQRRGMRERERAKGSRGSGRRRGDDARRRGGQATQAGSLVVWRARRRRGVPPLPTGTRRKATGGGAPGGLGCIVVGIWVVGKRQVVLLSLSLCFISIFVLFSIYANLI